MVTEEGWSLVEGSFMQKHKWKGLRQSSLKGGMVFHQGFHCIMKID